MEVHLTLDQEAQLAALATRCGKDQEQVVREAVDQFLNDTRFADAVRKGLASLDAGDYLDHAEVELRLSRALQA